MSETSLVMLIVPGFIICFGLLWTLIVLLISRLAGWSKLARQYPAPGPATGRTFSMSSARFGMFSSYRNCLTVTLSLSGIHLRPMFVFRMGHDPVLIPWTSVVAGSRQDFFLTAAFRIQVRDQEANKTKTITFYGNKLAAALEEHAQTYRIPKD